MTFQIQCVVGARPNFMKIAPLMHELQKYDHIKAQLVHTGQHYSENMSRLFFDELGLPVPDVYLGVGSANHGAQTGKIMIEFEAVLCQSKPDVVVVVGDVNSTLACALVAVKQGVPVAHIEAGLRSFDMSMPEEINRILTDRISEFLFVTEESGLTNLANEGIDKNKVHFVGNLMIDTLLKHLQKARESTILQALKLQSKAYAVLTLHRPSNVDSRTIFMEISRALDTIQHNLPIVFPIHPRTKQRLIDFDMVTHLESLQNLIMTEPLGYLDFLKLIAEARFVLTDSGGIQEETTVLGVPCLTLRENTERPVTVSKGTNVVVGRDGDRIVAESEKIFRGLSAVGTVPELWDGRAAERIVYELMERLD